MTRVVLKVYSRIKLFPHERCAPPPGCPLTVGFFATKLKDLGSQPMVNFVKKNDTSI